MSALLLTPLDYIAAGYWQDFLAKRPIAGGLIYENELQDCVLDESLASLQRVDVLLSQIRRDMIKAGQWQEETLLVDERYRNFMMFLAFYAGQVLARQWQYTPHWYGQFELRKRCPNLSLTTDDFYQHMAVVYRDDVESNVKNNTDTAVFFALEPIGLRLFGHIDRPFEAVQGGQVASGLYQAVSARLPSANDNLVEETTQQSITQMVDVGTKTNNQVSSKAAISAPLALNKPLDKLPEKITLNEVPVNTDKVKPVKPDEHETTQVIESETLSPVLPNTVPIDTVLKKPAPISKVSPTPEIFTQLLTELDEIEVVQTVDNAGYQQACHVLDQFEQHIAKQNKPRVQVTFSEKHLTAKRQALLTLKKAVDAGNTAAMLRLAMYELLGEGLAADNLSGTESGIELVKIAASKDDSRAQRLLSKMYYQGVGVTQDIDNGQYWLTQAAKNGHAEAANLVVYWEQAQDLISTQKQEQHSIKRYQILLGAVAVVALLILILL